MDKLEPCPFCGETVSVAKWLGDFGIAHPNTNECFIRHTDLYIFDTEAEAISAWNTRAPAEVTEAVLEKFRDAADVIAVYAQQPVETTRQRDRAAQETWEQAAAFIGQCYQEARAMQEARNGHTG